MQLGLLKQYYHYTSDTPRFSNVSLVYAWCGHIKSQHSCIFGICGSDVNKAIDLTFKAKAKNKKIVLKDSLRKSQKPGTTITAGAMRKTSSENCCSQFTVPQKSYIVGWSPEPLNST